MYCPNCANEIPDGNLYCGKCGTKASQTLGDLNQKLSDLDTKIKGMEKLDQQRLEIDTAKKVMTRVQIWAALILIPFSAAGIYLTVRYGQGAANIQNIAAKAAQYVQELSQKTRDEGSKAEATLNATRTTTLQLSKEIQATKDKADKLHSDVTERSNEVIALKNRLDAVRGDLEATKNAAAQIAQQVQAATQEKAVQEVTQQYPISFGEHMAMSAYAGRVDRKMKKPGEVWVVLSLFENSHQPFTADTFAATRTLVHAHYKTWDEYVSLISGSPSGGALHWARCLVLQAAI